MKHLLALCLMVCLSANAGPLVNVGQAWFEGEHVAVLVDPSSVSTVEMRGEGPRTSVHFWLDPDHSYGHEGRYADFQCWKNDGKLAGNDGTAAGRLLGLVHGTSYPAEVVDKLYRLACRR